MPGVNVALSAPGTDTTGATTDVPLRRYVVEPPLSLFETLAPKPL
jgi:hypothetical protein